MDPNGGKWKPGDVVNMVVSALQMLDSADDEQYGPQAALETAPDSGNGSDTGNRAAPDCRRGGEGWVDYGDVDSTHGNRATFAEACLDSAYLAAHPGTPTVRGNVPPGYKWARRYVSHLGGDRSGVNNCHLVGAQWVTRERILPTW